MSAFLVVDTKIKNPEAIFGVRWKTHQIKPHRWVTSYRLLPSYRAEANSRTSIPIFNNSYSDRIYCFL